MIRRTYALVLINVLVAAVFLLAPGQAAGRPKGGVKHRVERRPATRNNAAATPVDPPPTRPANFSVPPPSTASTGGSPAPSRGPSRIDFDDRLVTGQTNKSGSVYLYDRKELKTASMLKMRETFREEIVGSVYDR